MLTAAMGLLSDFFATMNRPCTTSQSRIVCIHASLLGMAPLRMSALNCSMIHARRVFSACISSASVLCRCDRRGEDWTIPMISGVQIGTGENGRRKRKARIRTRRKQKALRRPA